MDKSSLDVLVLNRNLRDVTDSLVSNLEIQSGVNSVGVIDAGSTNDQISKYTVVQNFSIEATSFGLRLNRGFNLGISWWAHQSNKSDYLLLLPNDAEIETFDALNLFNFLFSLSNQIDVAAVIPLSKDSPYRHILPRERVGLGWSFNEGPILLNGEFIEFMLRCGADVFDSDNFRGYLSFVELALKIYANNFAFLATDFLSFRENESHLHNHYELIITEQAQENARLLLMEGSAWLGKKYGVLDGISFENMVRQVFESFMGRNSDLNHLRLR